MDFVQAAIDAKGDSTFLVSVKENTGGERTATIALCAAADKKVREEFIVTQAQASDVELVITNKNDFRTSLDKLGSAATVKYSVQSTLTDPKNEIWWISYIRKKVAIRQRMVGCTWQTTRCPNVSSSRTM
mgnify:CR=1 FL=1